jgi:hypothetical protein
MINKNIYFKYNYSKFLMEVPEMTVPFCFDIDNGIKTWFEIEIGGEFVIIRAKQGE